MFVCLPAAPALSQPNIGGGACAASTLNGNYALVLNGRQTAAGGAITGLFQAVGAASFDGHGTVTLNLTANTVSTSQAFGTRLLYSGSYALQPNCIGTITLNSGDTGTFTLEAYANAFTMVGLGSTYVYNGTGTLQPAACPTAINGLHEFNGTGASLSGSSVTGVLDVAGTLVFDVKGNVTANWSQVSNLIATSAAATGTYTVGAGCTASATLTDASNNKYAVFISFNSTSPGFGFAVSSPAVVFDGLAGAMESASASCSASMLTTTYQLTLGGRILAGGVATKILVADGSATFDGAGGVTLALTSNAVNGSQAFGTAARYSGTYSVQPNCQGSISLTGGTAAAFSMVAYNIDTATHQIRSFTLVGTDAVYAYNGGGTLQPVACLTSTLSGGWPFSATGNTLSGSASTGNVDLAGLFQFDGQGNVAANWTQATDHGSTNIAATGTYSISSSCVGSFTLTDTSNTTYTGALSVVGATPNDFDFVAAGPQLIVNGGGRAAFVNPGQAVDNGASFLPSQTPAGSVFSIFGSNLASNQAQAAAMPLPTTLVNTSVTVNGEPAPLFYVSPDQINAQMPEDIQPGLATVIVKNGSAASNAVAVSIPATGTPGIVVYGDNRAVVVNQDGSVNSPSAPAKAGDTLVAYFTGGGPVNASGALVTGAGAPDGLSGVSGPYSIHVGGINVPTINYVGLTPGSIGLYQANFVLPSIGSGDRELVITISGQNSNGPLIAVK
jgi:uncharacterized protein (TIGR03437 family)